MGRRSRRRRFARLASIAVVGACVAIASPVFAAVATSTHDVKVHRYAAGSATATCPKGQHVSFGGVVAQYQPPGSGAQYVLPTGMRRTADDALTAYGFNNTRKKEGHLTAVAYCATGTVSTAVETSVLGGEGAADVYATCPGGTVVVGGGFDTHSSPRHRDLLDRLERSSPTRLHVTSTALTANPPTLTAIAYCAPGPEPTLSSATVIVKRHTGGSVRARCPSGTSLVFGGVIAQKTAPPYAAKDSAQVEAFSWTAPSPTEWVVTGFNVGGRAGALSALAYCR